MEKSKATFQLIFVLLSISLLLIPFVTSFNDILTRVIMRIKIYQLIQNLIVPFEAKMVVVVLRLIGFKAFPTLTSVTIGSPTIIGNNVTISWNCIGWQSFVLLVITLITGLQGSYHLLSKVKTIIIGVCGTFLLNIFRVTFVILLSFRLSRVIAIVFHDYFSTLLTIFWLFFFWWFSYTYVLEKKQEEY